MDLNQAITVERGHGRSETRILEVVSVPSCYIEWPGAAQVCRIIRRRTIKGQFSETTVYAVTSLPRERADARVLLSLNRRHWEIEGRLHLARDVTLAEDASRTRRGNSPQTFAAIRNTCLTLIRRSRLPPVQALEILAENRRTALAMIRCPKTAERPLEKSTL